MARAKPPPSHESRALVEQIQQLRQRGYSVREIADVQGSRNRTFMTSRPVSAASEQRAQPPQQNISPGSGRRSRLSMDKFALSIR
jgi:hypothetical protein